MIWLVLRRQRAGLLLLAGLVVVLVGVIATCRLLFDSDVARLGLQRCLTAPATCIGDLAWGDVQDAYDPTMQYLQVGLIAAPLLMGVLVGAGLFGRDLERGTHVFALTQGTGRLRWWAMGLMVAGLPAAAGAAVVSATATWGLYPLTLFNPNSTFYGPTFDTTGLVPAGQAVLAFAVAASIGLVARSALVAIVTAVVLQVVMVIGLSGFARMHYLPPESVRVAYDPAVGLSMPDDLPPGARVVDMNYLDGAGQVVPRELIIVAMSAAQCGADEAAWRQCFAATGVVATETRYQPITRFWPFQFIESGILAVLAGVALVVGAIGLRRRVY